MSKDAYWFRHDSTALRDLKMMQIKHIYDFWGIGLYWAVIEMLREQDQYRFKADESSLQLASSLVMCQDTPRFISWFNDCVRVGLFCKNDDYFHSQSLDNRMKKWESAKDNGKAGGRPKGNKTNYSSTGLIVPDEVDNGKHFVYLIKDNQTNEWKIGETSNLKKRRLTIKRATSNLSIHHFAILEKSEAYKIEKDVIREYSNQRISGDWFNFNAAEVRSVCDMIDRNKKPRIKPNDIPSESIRVEESIGEERREEKSNMPELKDFLEQGKKLCNKAGINFVEYEFSIEQKFNSWVSNNWKDGNEKDIKNWKNKLGNTIPHLKPIKKPKGGANLSSPII